MMRGSFVATALVALGVLPACGEIETAVDAPPGQIDAPAGSIDDPTRERLKAAANTIDRTPHWLIKQAIFNKLEKLEGGATLTELNGSPRSDSDDAGDVQVDQAHQ